MNHSQRSLKRSENRSLRELFIDIVAPVLNSPKDSRTSGQPLQKLHFNCTMNCLPIAPYLFSATILLAPHAAAKQEIPPAVPAQTPPTYAPEEYGGGDATPWTPEPVYRLAATSGPVTTWIEKAESTDEIIIQQSASNPYDVVQSETVAEGSSAFLLANVGFSDISVTLSPSITVQSDTRLFFQSQLGFATPNQVARVQIVVNGTPTEVWSLAGSADTSAPTQDGFELVTLDLENFVGQTVSVRFFYEFTDGLAFIESDLGWVVDNIQIDTSITTNPYEEFGEPKADEILLVELVNRARADAVAEATRLRNPIDSFVSEAISFFNVDIDLMETQFATLQRKTHPLAINRRLTASSRLHSLDMYTNKFQGHFSSSSPPGPYSAGDSLSQRVTKNGFAFSRVAENVYAHANSYAHMHAGFNIDWGTNASTGRSLGGMQDPAGHRINIHDPDYREVGVGIIHGTNESVGPMLVTQNFGSQSGFDSPFLVGVTIVDEDEDGFYDVGEGLGSVRVEVEGALYYADSSSEGAYAVPLPGDGAYNVTFTKPGYAPQTMAFSVTDNENVKIDYSAVAADGTSTVQTLKVELVDGNTIRMLVNYSGGSGDDLLAKSSHSLANPDWTPIEAVVTDLGQNKYQIDVIRSASPFYVRIETLQQQQSSKNKYINEQSQ